MKKFVTGLLVKSEPCTAERGGAVDERWLMSSTSWLLLHYFLFDLLFISCHLRQ